MNQGVLTALITGWVMIGYGVFQLFSDDPLLGLLFIAIGSLLGPAWQVSSPVSFREHAYGIDRESSASGDAVDGPVDGAGPGSA